jgi:hypothetical protein
VFIAGEPHRWCYCAPRHSAKARCANQDLYRTYPMKVCLPVVISFCLYQSHRIQNLPNAHADYDSYTDDSQKRSTCFDGTREKLLSEIASWICSTDADRPPIYILDGIAGIGKSTVAQTVAKRAAEIRCLGASFFFSRNEDRRKNPKFFFSSIAFQLSLSSPDFETKLGRSTRT